MKYTRQFIEARFGMAMDVLGVPHGQGYADGKFQVGTYFLDYYGMAGGYCIARVANEAGGVSTPFGSTRYKAADFANMLGVIMDTKRLLDSTTTS